jgi:PQQ-dependent dehydrogenase (methanol/ethanol family)
LSNIGRQSVLADIERKLKNPNAQVPDSYATVTVKLRDGRSVRGFARKETLHGLQLQTLDGKLMLLTGDEYQVVSRDKSSSMPALSATSDEERNLIAFLSKLGGLPAGPLPGPGDAIDAASIEKILHPRPGEWPTYNGLMSANRHSALEQINTRNVGKLALRWMYTIPYFGLESTPLVSDGVMYVSGPNQVYALDARTGQEAWRYSRPRTTNQNVAGDARLGANRGVALLGDRVFFVTDDAHLVCLDRNTGAMRWDVYTPEEPQRYGGTVAPLVVGDLVITGVAGADEGIRGFVAAYKASTGQLVWRRWTIPAKGEPGSETWQGSIMSGGSTWLTGSYDPETKVLYWPTGNPWPDTDGTNRKGDNLYTNCILAMDVETGKLRWHFQFTPHDLHDWDATEPPVLVDTLFKGRQRKLLLHADRNGFFYVLDRTNGELLLAKAFAKKVTWASGIGPDGRPVLTAGNIPTPEGTPTCPDIRGAANWMATAFSPATSLYYLMTIENCGTYRSTQFGGTPAPAGRGGGRGGRGGGGGGMFNVVGGEPAKRLLRAIDINTGVVAWEVDQKIPNPNYSGVLSTAGGIVFYSESGGAFSAVDAKTGRNLWHFQASESPKSAPMTYMVNGKQFVAVTSGANVLSFALPD